MSKQNLARLKKPKNPWAFPVIFLPDREMCSKRFAGGELGTKFMNSLLFADIFLFWCKSPVFMRV